MKITWDPPGSPICEIYGEKQFTFLKEEGLLPEHYILDIGSGPLCLGTRLLPYLEIGHYYGIDIDKRALDLGLKDVKEKNLESRSPHVVLDGNFELEKLGQTFNFIMANSVFTHLPDSEIKKCLNKIPQVLKTGGKFYATVIEGGDEEVYFFHPLAKYNLPTFRNNDPYHQPMEFYKSICPKELDLEIKTLGWDFPECWKLLIFSKRSDLGE